jgi:hypothetical protein
MGLYHALLELDRFREAGDVRTPLERETPPWLIDRGVLRYNFNREGVTLAQGWWLAYQDRLAEAQTNFEYWLSVAPASLAARTGLAQILDWRGRPAAAKQEFDIILTLAGSNLAPREAHAAPPEMPARNGRVGALNNLGFRRDARAEGRALQEDCPGNLHTRRINRSLALEDRPELLFDFVNTVEDPGAREDEERLKLTVPLTPLADVYAFGLRRYTAAGEAYLIRRYGAGAHWLALPPLTLQAEISRDVQTAGSGGWMGRVYWRIDDSWSTEAGYNSYSLSVPLRARAAGVEATSEDVALRYRPNESWAVRGVGAWQDYDDGNANRFYGLFPERALFTRARLKTRLFGEVSRSENARSDASYFSPDYAMTYELTHMIEHTVFRRYERGLAHRLYLGAGLTDEAGYGGDFIWDGRYEQDYRFDPRTVLLWGVLYKDRHYGGDRTQSTSWYLTFRRIL